MLPWTSTYELTKGGSNNFAASVQWLQRRPEAVSVAYATVRIYQETERPFVHLTVDVTHPRSTRRLREILRRLADGSASPAEVRERLEGTTRDTGDLVRGLNFPQLVRHGVEMMLENGLSGDERHAIRVRRDEKRLDVGAEAGAAEHDDARDGPCREGGGKGPGHGKHGRAKRAPDSAPGSWRAPCARPCTPKNAQASATTATA